MQGEREEAEQTTPMGSVKSLFKTLSDRSREFLAMDITASSRKKRRERECKRRGVTTMQEGDGEGLVSLSGMLRISPSGKFGINDDEFLIDEKTWIFGELIPGKHVQIHIETLTTGEKRAKKIVVRA